MNFYHYSELPFTLDVTRRYEQSATDIKPHGLWLSVDDDWQRWCEGEKLNGEGLRHRTEIVISEGARILTLDSVYAIDRFTEEYRHTILRDTLRSIRWTQVAEEYQGIVIAPYQWERRLTSHTFWYYTWDCASACVWDSSVLSVRQEASPCLQP